MAKRVSLVVVLIGSLVVGAAAIATMIRASSAMNDERVTLPLPGPITWQLQQTKRSTFRHELRSIGLALHNYHDTLGRFPPGGTFAPDGKAGHSWMTPIGPYLTFYIDDLREDEPWNSEHNAKYFRSVIRNYLNPSLAGAPTVDEHGFGLSHIAANQHVMGPGRSMSFEDVTDGTTTTLLVGEVSSRFQPWGAPTNWRDPMQGLNQSVFGFGSHAQHGGVLFLLADGSVRFFAGDTEQSILKALATPDGGETVDISDDLN